MGTRGWSLHLTHFLQRVSEILEWNETLKTSGWNSP